MLIVATVIGASAPLIFQIYFNQNLIKFSETLFFAKPTGCKMLTILLAVGLKNPLVTFK